MEQESLATELLHTVKANCRRWFIAFVIMVVLEIITIAGFLWYVSLPVEEYTEEYTQTIDDIDSSDVRQIIGSDE